MRRGIHSIPRPRQFLSIAIKKLSQLRKYRLEIDSFLKNDVFDLRRIKMHFLKAINHEVFNRIVESRIDQDDSHQHEKDTADHGVEFGVEDQGLRCRALR